MYGVRLQCFRGLRDYSLTCNDRGVLSSSPCFAHRLTPQSTRAPLPDMSAEAKQAERSKSVQFFGVIYPRITVLIVTNDIDGDGQWSVDVTTVESSAPEHSAFTATVHYVPLPHDAPPTAEHQAAWRNAVTSTLNRHLSMLTFSDTIVYKSHITYMKQPNGHTVTFAAGHMGVQKEMDYKRLNAIMIKLGELDAWTNCQLSIALGSYRAMLDPTNRYMGLFLANHTLEALRKHWQGPGDKRTDKQTWTLLRGTLKIDQALLRSWRSARVQHLNLPSIE